MSVFYHPMSMYIMKRFKEVKLMTDREILNLYSQNPEKAITYLVDKYSALVYTIVYSKLGNVSAKEDIEETVADVFIQLFRYTNNIDLEKGSIKSYISVMAKRIAQRKAMTIINKEKALSIDDLSNSIPFSSEEIKQKENRQVLLECIKKLGKPDSDILVLKYFYGLKSKEIGKTLGIKTNTVDKRISRSLKKLREKCEEEFL